MATSAKSTEDKTVKSTRKAAAKQPAASAKAKSPSSGSPSMKATKSSAVAEASQQPLNTLRDSLKALTQDSAATLAELKQKSAEIEKAIAVHQKNLQRSVKAFIAEVVQEFGLTVDDLDGIVRGKSKGSTGKAQSVVKFCDPDNAENTWSGRGARPKWLAERITRGAGRFVDAASPAYAEDAKLLNERLAKKS
ncbi:H-NS histone family protein [Chitinivorax sp. PXF-14]|uniref:H-NS histone family protein n=1 Tax=Chitinivorax sp. PXF-14 TaxID=3230488 RepID=UPI00346504A9